MGTMRTTKPTGSVAKRIVLALFRAPAYLFLLCFAIFMALGLLSGLLDGLGQVLIALGTCLCKLNKWVFG